MKLRHKQVGATAIEYALIAALIAVASIAGFTALGKNVQTSLNDVSAALINE